MREGDALKLTCDLGSGKNSFTLQADGEGVRGVLQYRGMPLSIPFTLVSEGWAEDLHFEVQVPDERPSTVALEGLPDFWLEPIETEVVAQMEAGGLVGLALGIAVDGQLFDARAGEPREPGDPLTILLYPTRQEYMGQSTRANSLPEAAFGWTAGHYSPQENLSRLYLPEMETSYNNLLEVYAHELTHHWLATRSPFARRQGSPSLPFWVVEGFANLVSEFSLDPANQAWEARNPRAASLDKLRALPSAALLPWEDFFAMDQAQFAQLGKQPRGEVTLSWTLGLRLPVSTTQIFYIQAGALAQLLFHESEATRQQLLEYVRAWYEVDRPALAPQAAFGGSATDLGRRAEDFARR